MTESVLVFLVATNTLLLLIGLFRQRARHRGKAGE